MSYEIDADYSTTYLLPPCLEDWVPERHPARFIRTFVDQIDFDEYEFHVRKSRDGRPSYSAKLMLRVWLYCWFERIRSFRDVERACYSHLALLWLTGLHYPDHNTVWRFWRDNQKSLRKVFRKSARVALECDLVQLVLHAVDGTKIVAASKRGAALHRSDLEKIMAEVDKQIEQMSNDLNSQPSASGEDYLLKQELADAKQLKSQVEQALNKLDAHGVDRLQPSEPEAAMMKTPTGKQWAYNAQAVADEASSIIVACDVVSEESDNHQLMPMLDQVKENLGTVARCTAGDGGFEDGPQLAQAEQAGYHVVVNVRDPGEKDAYHISHFDYDESRDEWICPQGKRLSYQDSRVHHEVVYRCYTCSECGACPVKSLCTKQSNRTVRVHEHLAVLSKHRAQLKEYEPSRALDKRKHIIEPRFGWIKERMGFRRFTVRGREKAKTQWACVCTTWNLRRMWKLIWGECVLADLRPSLKAA